MGKHGKRASAFKASLVAAGYDVLETPREHGVVAATTKQLSDEVRASMVDVYRALGGVRDDAEFTAGVWDFACSDGLFVEFDEALHFNRYRPVTLQTSWSSELPWAQDYSGYSGTMEGMCLKDGKSGGRWASPSSDAMFGGSDAPGVFSEKGSSRWKQRALYDAVRDAHARFTPGLTLARVSIHDEIGGLSVNWATSHGLLLDPMELREFIESRTA